jgi:2'-5' RNA ligase
VRQSKDVRLFFALWPPTALRRQLHEAACAIPLAAGARRVPRSNLHLTLHFIGNVYFAQMDCLQAVARRVDARRFRLDLDCQGFFARPRVAWLGCREIPSALVDLHRELGARLRSCDYQPELRPYHPHVTVARKTGPISTAVGFDPLCWAVNEFALVEVQAVENGVHYRVVETYPLI